MSDFAALLEAINRAGFSYKSEWLGDETHKIAQLTVSKGARKKGTWFGANPEEAASRACEELHLDVGR